jgi:gliding motility-associated-like protein
VALNNPSISNPSAEPELTTEYQITVTDGNNCRNNDSVTVYVVLNDTCIIQIYNLISPNGDNDNDVWWIDGIKFFPENNVRLFNRWGAKVWQGKGYDNDKVIWKGDNQNGVKLPVSTYYYIIELGDRTITGFVELVQ